MKKNGLTIAGMIVILSGAGVLVVTSLIALFSAKNVYLGDDWIFYYYGVHTSQYDSAAKTLSEVRIALGCLAIFALIVLLFAFKNKKAVAITGIVLASLSLYFSLGMLIVCISAPSNIIGEFVKIDIVWIALMFIASIALLVGAILKLVGVNKLNKQLAQQNTASE
ncbi:MAG: hypothetical protein IKZ82_14025 [Clostridia bacterium]|nr:hypothetical protein [Clostridia bacterium]